MIRTVLGLLALFASGIAAPAVAQQNPHVTYEVQSGDTLYTLAMLYMNDPDAVPQVQRLNAIANARSIPIGTVIRIPRSLLRFVDVDLSVAAFSGPVQVAGSAPVPGTPLREGHTDVTSDIL